MKKLLILAMALVAGAHLSGCSKGPAPSQSADGAKDAAAPAKVKLAFVTNNSSDFWVYAEAGVRKAEAEFGDIAVEFKNGDGTTARQRQLVDDLLIRGIKGVAISSVDPKGQTEAINGWAKEAAIICVDSDASESDRITYLGTDNVAAGRKCGELLKEALPEGGKVMVFVGLKDAQNALERFNGLKEAVAGTAIEIIDLRTDGGDAAKARANAEDTITRYPDIAAMVGLWSYNPPAILAAVKAAGMEGKIKIVAFDEDPATLNGLDAGFIHGTICQDPYTFGYESMVLLHKIAVEGLAPEAAGIPAGRVIHVDTTVLRQGEGQAFKETCDAYKAGLN